MKVIVAGSRDFTDYDKVKEILNKEENITEIVCGGAKGADTLGEYWAKENNIPIKYFIPDWNRYDRSAGPIRNREMSLYADKLIAFWDGKSRGTKNMIENMKKLNKSYKIINIE